MTDQERQFVKIEYVGGPWDGKVEVRDYPLPFERVRVPLQNPPMVLNPDPVAASQPLFRIGEYCRVHSGDFDVVSVSEQATKGARAYHPSQLAAQHLEGRRPVVFGWRGEQP